MKINKKIAGITLIALVITIIVLLILAGISISMLSGDNSILNQAGRARDITVEKSIAERVQIAYLGALAEGKGDTTEEGLTIALNNEFGFGNYTLSQDLSKVTIDEKDYYFDGTVTPGGGGGETQTVSDLRTASISNGVTALSDTGTTTIKDNKDNEIKVPKGFGIATDSGINVAEGIVIEDVSHTDTKGSQFVWVPVGTITKADGSTETITLGRYKFNFLSYGTETPVQAQTGTTYTATTASSIIGSYYYEFKDDAESQSVKSETYGNTKAKNLSGFVESAIKNGGYYIARYEAGINADKDQYAYANCSGYGTSLTYGDSSKKIEKDGSIKPLSIKGKGIWNAVTQPEAAIISINMYTDLNSDLVNSYAWDTAISFIEKCGTNSNYANKTDGNGKLKTAGNNSDEQCKISDMAGNVYEWTTETSSNTDNPCVVRGGIYYYTDDYTAYRGSNRTSYSYNFVGFRPIFHLF